MHAHIKSLFEKYGQSIWLDNISRSMLNNGGLQRLIDIGVRGLTSNPSIFQKAIEESSDYDEEYKSLVDQGRSPEEIYWQLVIDDIRKASDILQPVYEASNRQDGFVSIEVDPRLAHDIEGTVRMAKDLNQRVAKNNVLIKIPATQAGLSAIEEVIAEGINVNVTLIFSTNRYLQVRDSYLKGLQRFEGDKSKVHSVASFFISRIDSAVDPLLEAAGPAHLKGSIGVSQAKAAYGEYLSFIASSHWQTLTDSGATPQKLLWASTSTKNPEYSDTKYVDELIARDTINTVPDKTIELFEEHGHGDMQIDESAIDDGKQRISELEQSGIDFSTVANQLEDDGVKQFVDAFEDVVQALSNKQI